MNSRNKFATNFKAPFLLHNRHLWEPFFELARNYILTLKCDDENLLNHRRKTFALGFFMNTYSYQNLALEFLERNNDPLEYFLAYKTSQDHLELTFSCVRNCGGRNDNPHVLQLS